MYLASNSLFSFLVLRMDLGVASHRVVSDRDAHNGTDLMNAYR